MPWSGIVAVGGGAAAGAWLRWGLGALLNPIFPTLPLGTLAANLVGGLLMGIAMEVITRHAVLSPEARLLITTGLPGRAHDVLDVFGRNGHAAAAARVPLGIDRDRVRTLWARSR